MNRSLEFVTARLVLIGGLPAVATALWLLWAGDYSVELRWTLSVLLPTVWAGCAVAAHSRTVRPLQLLVNLLGALREGDYSLRGAAARPGHMLGDVMLEVNALGETLHRQRLSAVEATALLSSVLGEIDVAIFAFDDADRLRLANRAGAELLARPSGELIGRHAWELGMGGYLKGETPRILDRVFAGARGRWELRRSEFRQDGRPHRLVVLADLSRALREEERQAWQRIVRVLSHEINNSLAPIQSIARSVQRIVDRELEGSTRAQEVREGLTIVASRSESLGRLMSEYARMAKLPRPVLQPIDIRELVHGVTELEKRVPVRVRPGVAGMRLSGDRDQLEQLLINLVRNAAEASLETGGGVSVEWRASGDQVEILIEDDGPGIADAANLFVPFFTTKPSGSGIGLALSRQIAEAHGGTLSLENRESGAGARATLRLPRAIRTPGSR
jgi:nitrogen fixation/metabolism regulation signal transduction histidine kinase